jgi:hypothetical protein
VEEVQPVLDRWVREHPILDLSLGLRAAGADRAAAAAAATWGTSGLQAVAQIDETARDLTDRLAIYAEQMPNLARWEAELAALEAHRVILTRPLADLDTVTRDISRIEGDIDGFTKFALSTPDVVASERSLLLAAVEEERRAILDSVDRQRVDTLMALQGEREVILASLEELRRATFTDVGDETGRSLDRIDAIRIETLEELDRITTAAIDRAFWRALELVGIVLVGAGLLVGIARLPATASWPRAIPPSFGGTFRWRRTSNPFPSSAGTTLVVRSMFWKTPPESATRASPWRSRRRRQVSTTSEATDWWNRRAISDVSSPERFASTTARTRGRMSTTRQPPSSRNSKG